MKDRKIVETFPQYTIDGVDLNEEQCLQYEDLLDNCAGDENLCKEVWRMFNFIDGDTWTSMDAVRSFENDQSHRASIEGFDLPEID